MQKPVILLAFANERQPDGVYLNHLPRERKLVKSSLDQAEKDGLCESDFLPDATLDQVFGAFRRFKDRIAVFHFSGHANHLELLLENMEGKTVAAHARGLAKFLGAQNGLELVFLNGCYTLATAQALLDRGVPAVIGTVQAVKDQVATDLSGHFYEALAGGLSIGEAWEAATGQMLSGQGGPASEFYDEKSTRGGGFEVEDDRPPWQLLVRPGAAEVKNWNLPAASNNPTFGLPKVPDSYPLPETPYQFLKRYKPADAPIFFGRGEYLSGLYRRLTGPAYPPVILLHGQSGVGKSSLLGAGLLPRLEGKYETAYHRREPRLGLVAGLMQVLDARPGPSQSKEAKAEAAGKISQNIRQLEAVLPTLEGGARTEVERNIAKFQAQLEALELPAVPDLAAAWKRKEEEAGRPLIVILDQVEEIFTRPNAQLPDELDDLAKQVKAIFNTPENRPKGKLLLSYRKDFWAEIDETLGARRIDRESVFLDRMSRNEVMEVINGLSSTQRLRDFYRLEVEENLDVEIADDLIADKDSPVAPVLQIILTKMWQQEEGKQQRHFTRENYRQLRKEGILLGDFFHQQMDVIKAWEMVLGREVESSGLALDMLNFHTTELGTARSHDLQELQNLYQHQADILDDLIARFQELYLLTGTDERRFTLGHDTLAPIVQREIHESDRPGQRALRILEAKAADFAQNPEETVIEEDDLALVERGENGMRRWTVQEQALIKKSRERRARLQAERRRNRLMLAGLAVLVALFGVASFFLWQRTLKQKNDIAADLLFNRGELEVAGNPTVGIEKMKDAYDLSPTPVKRGKIFDVFEKNLFYDTLLVEQNGELTTAAFSPDGSLAATAVAGDFNVRLYRPGEPEPTILRGPNYPLNELVFFKNEYLFAASDDGFVYRWPVGGGQPEKFGAPQGQDALGLRTLAVSDAGDWLCSLEEGTSPRLQCWQLPNGSAGISIKLEGEATSLQFFPKTSDVLVGMKNGAIFRYPAEGGTGVDFLKCPAPLTHLAISPDGQYQVTVSGDSHVLRWNGSSPLLISGVWEQHEGPVLSMRFSPDGHFLIGASSDGTASVCKVDDRVLRYTLRGHTGPVVDAVFTQKMDAILTAGTDGVARRWEFPYPYPAQELTTQGNKVEGLAFAADGRSFTAVDKIGNQFKWQLSGEGRFEAVPGFSGGEAAATFDASHTDSLATADGQLVFRHARQGECGFSAFSPEGFLVKKFQPPPGQSFTCREPVMAVDPAGQVILTADLHGKVFVWKMDRAAPDLER